MLFRKYLCENGKKSRIAVDKGQMWDIIQYIMPSIAALMYIPELNLIIHYNTL